MLQMLLLLFSLQAFSSPKAITISEIYASDKFDPLGDWLELSNNTKTPLLVENMEIVHHKSNRRAPEHFEVQLPAPLLLKDFLILSDKEWLFPFDGLVDRESFLFEPRLSVKNYGAQKICIIVNKLHEACVEISSSTRFLRQHALFPYPGAKNLMNVETCETMPGYFVTPGLPPEVCLTRNLASKYAPSIVLRDQILSIIDDDPNETFLISICRGERHKGICNLLHTLRTSLKEISIEQDHSADFIKVQDSFGLSQELALPKSPKVMPELKGCRWLNGSLSLTLFLPDDFAPTNFRLTDESGQIIRSGAYSEGGPKNLFLYGLASNKGYKLKFLRPDRIAILDIKC